MSWRVWFTCCFYIVSWAQLACAYLVSFSGRVDGLVCSSANSAESFSCTWGKLQFKLSNNYRDTKRQRRTNWPSIHCFMRRFVLFVWLRIQMYQCNWQRCWILADKEKKAGSPVVLFWAIFCVFQGVYATVLSLVTLPPKSQPSTIIIIMRPILDFVRTPSFPAATSSCSFV